MSSFLYDCSTALIVYGKTHNMMLLVLCGQEPKKKEQIIDEIQKLF